MTARLTNPIIWLAVAGFLLPFSKVLTAPYGDLVGATSAAFAAVGMLLLKPPT